MSKRAGRKPATSKRPKSKLGFPDLDHSKAAVLDSFVRQSPNGVIGMRSMSLSSGIVLSHDFLLIRWWSPAFAFSSRSVGSQRPRSMADLQPSAGWPMKLRMPACSVQSWQPASGELKVRRS